MTLANHLPRLDFFGPINMRMQFPDVSEEQHEWFQLNGDYDFPRTFGLKLLAGRDFDPKNIESECFGGSNYNDNSSWNSSYYDNSRNAYMLVYERQLKN